MAESAEIEIRGCSLDVKGRALGVGSVTGEVKKGGVENDETFYDAESSALRRRTQYSVPGKILNCPPNL